MQAYSQSYQLPVLATLVLAVCCTSVGGTEPSWTSEQDAATLRADMERFFAGNEVRTPGSPGNLAIADKIAQLFADSGAEHGEIQFRAPCFIPGKASITVKGQAPIRLLPMHPTLFRPGNFQSRDFSVDLVYMGNGRAADLDAATGTDLDGVVALLEFGADWQNLLRFGITGFVFIEPTTYDGPDTRGKVHVTEVNVPRFLVSATEAASLRTATAVAGGKLPVRIQSEPSRWQNRILRDLWVFIPGSDERLTADIAVITAPIDSNCVVPDMATGAQAAANLYLLTTLLEKFRKTPPARSLMLVAVNAHTQYYKGERLLAWNLLAPISDVEALREEMADDLRLQELMVDYYTKLHLDGKHDAGDEKYLKDLRSLTDKSIGRYVTIKEPIVDLIKRDVNRLRGLQLDLQRSGLPRAEIDVKRDALEQERRQHVRILTMFNRVGILRTLGELYQESPESVGLLRNYVEEILTRNRLWADLNRNDLAMSNRNTAIRNLLAGRRVSFVLSLDFDWASDKIGFGSSDVFGHQSNWQSRFGRNTVRIGGQLAGVTQAGRPNLLVDTMTKLGGLQQGYYFAVQSSEITVFHAANATPAFSLKNAYTSYVNAFTPTDTFKSLPATNVAAVTRFVPVLLRAILADPDISATTELPPYQRKKSNKNTIWSIRLRTFRFDKFSASVLPSLPVPSSSVILYGPNAEALIDPRGIIGAYIGLTDQRATTVVYGIDLSACFSSAFHYDDDFLTVDHAIDAGDTHQRISSNVRKATARTFALFKCEEFPIYDRNDWSLISAFPIGIKACHVLSATCDSAPQAYGFTGVGGVISSKTMPDNFTGPFAIYTEPGERVKLLTKKKRAALNSSSKDPMGTGYSATGDMGPDFFAASARDMAALNRFRIASLRGVSDELTQDFLARGEKALGEMALAAEQHNHLARLRSLYRALGAQAKAYDQIISITNDMLKAVVFYVALMLPFCFFLQKLVFKFVKIEIQMALFIALFVCTFVIFRTIHPAFRIAEAPEAMFVAFVMGALGIFVIKVLHDRFEGEMQLLFQTYTGMDTSQVAYSSVGQQAMLIGVNNMKRRRIRTSLTTATVVLVTFTMLSFSSISKKMSPTIVSRGTTAPYTGIMYHWPGQLMDTAIATVLENMFTGKGEVIMRRWLVCERSREDYRPERVPMQAGCVPQNTAAQVQAILGLATVEDGLVERIPLIPGGRFFSANDAREVIIPAGAADTLGVTPEMLDKTTLTFRGMSYKVVGILDDDRFRAMRDIDNKPLIPIQVKKRGAGQAEARTAKSEFEEEDESGVEYVDLASLLIMPVDAVAELSGNKIFSVCVRFPDNEPIWPHMDELLTVTRAKFYVSSRVPFAAGGKDGRELKPGVYYIGSGYRTSIGGLATLIVPLLIASTIILNTMLGSVYERRSEISVYNAVGLNPTHIGMFFLAEAFVYSIIGSVGGYLIGQVLSISLNKFGLITDINLNFSSLSVVYVILFTISVVLISTIYPAYVATKAAVPSGKRKWSIPDHDGKRMNIVFPFIYQEDLVPGIMGYLHEYFSRFTVASVGDLIAELQASARTEDADQRPTYTLSYNVALAPFDLGVTQMVTFTARYDSHVQAYRVFMLIERLSGQDTNWVTTNRPFLERLRQYMLHWRNLERAEHATFVELGRKAFCEE